MVVPVTISLEVELGWGTHDLPEGPDRTMFSSGRQKETKTLRKLLHRCDELDLPLTFDIVGHLIEDTCAGSHRGPHRPGWFDADPGTDATADPLFYASDLVDTIDEADVEHEIATHTYSHVLFDEAEPIVADWELRKVREVHDSFGINPPVSLVPPRHRKPSFERLKKHGIDAIRLPIKQFKPDKRRKFNTFSRILGRSHPHSRLETVAGTVLSYTSFEPSLTAPFLPNGQHRPHPVFRSVPLPLREHIQRRYLSKALKDAIRSETHLHLWSHLGNLANDWQLRIVDQFLNELANAVQRDEVKVLPMSALPGWVS